jgi:hypothetical protein
MVEGKSINRYRQKGPLNSGKILLSNKSANISEILCYERKKISPRLERYQRHFPQWRALSSRRNIIFSRGN